MRIAEEAKEITVSINDRTFSLDISIKDQDLIEEIFKAFREYIKKGAPIKVKQTYMAAPSESLKMISKIITKQEQVNEWRDETRQLISVLRKKN
jgi:hypothetical protein